MTALVNICKKKDDLWECHGPYACIGIGKTIVQAEDDLHHKIDDMRSEIEQWTGHRLTLSDRYAA